MCEGTSHANVDVVKTFSFHLFSNAIRMNRNHMLLAAPI